MQDLARGENAVFDQDGGADLGSFQHRRGRHIIGETAPRRPEGRVLKPGFKADEIAPDPRLMQADLARALVQKAPADFLAAGIRIQGKT